MSNRKGRGKESGCLREVTQSTTKARSKAFPLLRSSLTALLKAEELPSFLSALLKDSACQICSLPVSRLCGHPPGVTAHCQARLPFYSPRVPLSPAAVLQEVRVTGFACGVETSTELLNV